MPTEPTGDAERPDVGDQSPAPAAGASGASRSGLSDEARAAAAEKDLAFAIDAARLLDDRKCEDVVLLDLRGLSEVTNFVVIGTGTSDRQMKSVADELRDIADEEGQPTFARDRDPAATWIVVDFVNLIVHLFEPNQRAYYDLESLWGDAPRMMWRRLPGSAGDAADG
jgi:ribosome-associated protein